VAFYITKHGIIDKIEALRNATHKVALGNLEVRVSDQVSGGELGELGEAFDHMSCRLSDEMAEVNRNIRQRLRAEEALKESSQQLMDIIDFLPDPTFVLDIDKRIIAWNRAMEELTGQSKENILGQGDYAYTIPFYGERRKHLIDLLDMDDEELKSKYRNVTRKGETLYAEAFTPALYDGRGAYVWAIGAPLYNTEGKRVGAIESIRDITEKKNAEELRDNNLALIESLLNNSPASAYLMWNQESACLSISRRRILPAVPAKIC
jgi:PAS domain S-box-containing protein